MVITEFGGAGIDAVAFTRALRLSTFGCRRAPVIVASSQPKASEITAARDAGAHEFLRKPYSATDLRRRVENVACKTRPWIEAVAYVGPDRRRFNSGGYSGARRRNADHDVQRPQSASQRFMQALAILSSAVKSYDSNPTQAVRSMQAQVEILSTLALRLAEPRLVNSVSALDRYLASANQSGSSRAIQALLEDGATPLTDLAEAGAALDLDKAA
jgi:response regulator RpfG family c-di-GMP phosphodiesterase